MSNETDSKLINDIRDKIWDGKMPVKFSVLPEHISEIMRKPKPLYKVLRRNTYLFLENESVDNIFKHDMIVGNIWFKLDINKEIKPLQWHVPFGVLIDTYLGYEPKIPIEIIADYGQAPADKLLTKFTEPAALIPIVGLRSIDEHYYHSFKEAIRVRFDSQYYTKINSKDKSELFEAIKSWNKEKFDKFFKMFWFPKEPTSKKGVPIRVLANDYPNLMQKRAPVSQADGAELKLGDFLKEAYPKLKFHWDQDISSGDKYYQVISQGILLEYNYSMEFLSDNLFGLDGFVYLSFHSLTK